MFGKRLQATKDDSCGNSCTCEALRNEVMELKTQLEDLLKCFDVKVEKKMVLAGTIIGQQPSRMIFGYTENLYQVEDEIVTTKTYKLKRSAIEGGEEELWNFGFGLGCTPENTCCQLPKTKKKAKKK